jgi:hypothetical protein
LPYHLFRTYIVGAIKKWPKTPAKPKREKYFANPRFMKSFFLGLPMQWFLTNFALSSKKPTAGPTSIASQLPVLSNQKYNGKLKALAEGLGFGQVPLTTHIARKTYTTVFLNKGVPFAIVSVRFILTNPKRLETSL